MAVVIPVTTKYDPKGVNDAERDLRRAQQAAIRATREQIAEHRRVNSLTAKLDRDLANEQKRQAKELADFKGKLRTGAGAVIGAGAILGAAGMQAVEAARESIASEKELQAALNSTGKAAQGYKEQLAGLATELQNTSNFSDEAVQHAESVLLTFDKVGRDIMPRATQAVADLGEMFGGTTEDLQSSAMQIGKALDGNISALKRSGVSFTKSQEEQIAALFEAGKVAEAQGLIMAQLEKQVSGQAQAARDAAGGTKDLQVASDELTESAGKLLLAIGDSGIGGGLATMIGWLDDGAKAWTNFFGQTEIAGRALDIMAEKQGVAAGSTREFLENIPLFGSVVKAGEFVGALATRQDELAGAMSQAGQEMAAEKAAAEANTRALKAEGGAAEDDAASHDDLEKSLKAANAARRDVAGALIDITEKAAADTIKVNEDFAKEDAKLLADHYEANQKIQANSEKERAANAKQLAKDLTDVDKDLAKDLAKVDKELAKDKAKLDRDTSKQIARMQQDAAREEKQQRRARLIDARGDERLFQFDMRQLAAEGSFNAIQEAMERRAIEQQIEAEKLQEEQKARDDNSRIEIDRVRQDAAERKAEMEAEAADRRTELETAAEERRAQLQDQAAEEEVRRQEELAQALADEQANYDERQAALVAARDEKLAAIEETKNEAIKKLAEEQTQNQELTREGMEATKAIAAEFGPEIGRIYAEGMNEGFARNLRISEIAGSELSGGAPDTGRPSSRPGAQNRPQPLPPPRPSSRPGAQNRRFQHGGDFIVGGSGGPDSQLVEFMATPGERVTVAAAGQNNQIVVNVNGIGGTELAAIIRRKVEEGVAEFYEAVIVPWGNG